MSAALKINFQNDRQNVGATGVTRNRGRVNGRVMVMGTSSRRRETNVAAEQMLQRKIVVLTERDAAERLSASVTPYSAGDLAKAARRTKPAAKGWKDASRCPNYSSMVSLARSIPAVRAMVLEDIDGGDRTAGSADSIVNALRKLAKAEGPEGDLVRTLLREAGQ